MYDVCIVGAGIAGSTLSYNLGSKFRTCIIEWRDNSELGNKPCGDAVHLVWFRGGIRPNPDDLGAVIQKIDRIELNLKDERFTKNLDEERKGIMIDRKKYVSGAIERALDEGCELIKAYATPKFSGGSVSHIDCRGENIKAKIYVDASGVKAVIRSHYLPNNRGSFFLGYREIVEHELGEAAWKTYLFGPDESYWVFARGPTTNLGVVKFCNARADHCEKLEKFKKFLGLEKARVVTRGWGLIPSRKPIDLVYGNAVAIGDAGFTVNPLSGGGIGPSIHAANLLADSLKKGESLSEFNLQYRSTVGKDYERFYKISRVLLWTRKFAWRWALKRAFMKFY